MNVFNCSILAKQAPPAPKSASPSTPTPAKPTPAPAPIDSTASSKKELTAFCDTFLKERTEQPISFGKFKVDKKFE